MPLQGAGPLSYLRAMLDPHFSCGLNGEFGYPGLEGWREEAARLAEEMKQRFGGITEPSQVAWSLRSDWIWVGTWPRGGH